MKTSVHCVQVAAWINNTRTRLQQGGRPPGGRGHGADSAGGRAADQSVMAQARAHPSEPPLSANLGGRGPAASEGLPARRVGLDSGRVGAQQLEEPDSLPRGLAPLGAAGHAPLHSGSSPAQQQACQQMLPPPRGPPQAARPSYPHSSDQAAAAWQPPPDPAWQQGTLRTGRPYLGAVPYAAPQTGPQKRRRGVPRAKTAHFAPWHHRIACCSFARVASAAHCGGWMTQWHAGGYTCVSCERFS